MDIFGESLSKFFQDGTTYSFRFLLAILIFLVGWWSPRYSPRY